MSVPSFERFDYLLRTNKHIERQLVFDLLHAVAQRLSFSRHWYTGFGSMWFGDFRLAHRLLGISRLVSMELPEYADRATFNKPFAGVQVAPGESGTLLAALDADTWSNPVIAWLDYDGYLDADVVKDVGLLLTRAAMNSVVIVTVNAARGTYRVRRQSGVLARHETAVGVVEGFLGAGSVASRFEPQQNAAGAYGDVSEGLFPEFLCDSIASHMSHGVLASARVVDGHPMTFLPLFKLHHKDGADMVTVGGVVTSDADAGVWQECLSSQSLLVDAHGAASYCRLDLKPITVKEKIVMDECLPYNGDDSAFLASARAAGLALQDAELAKYRRYYRHFPVFVETTI